MGTGRHNPPASCPVAVAAHAFSLLPLPLLLLQGTFIAAQQTPVHPTKPGLSVVSSVPILPDFDSWEDKYVTVSFEEGDPAQDSKALGQVGWWLAVCVDMFYMCRMQGCRAKWKACIGELLLHSSMTAA